MPQTLAGRRVVGLDLAGLVAGSEYRDEFEERLKKVVEEVKNTESSTILFIDELHTVVAAGSGGEGAMDAGNMLKPALARGELHVVGATTIDEYRKHVEKDAALERRFQPVLVPEPTVAETVQILEGLRDSYEAHHQVRFADEALATAAELSDRYVSDRFLKLRREKDEAVAAEKYEKASQLKERIAETEAELAGVEERREGGPTALRDAA